MNLSGIALASIAGHILTVAPWAKAGSKFVGFLAYFAVVGALGYRLVGRRLSAEPGPPGAAGAGYTTAVLAHADRRAACIGLFGACLLLPDFAMTVAWRMPPGHPGLLAAVTSARAEDLAEGVLAPLLIIAFTLAIRRRPGGWTAAFVFGTALAVRQVLAGRLRALVNPLHEAAAALWLGTLFVLVLAFLPAVLGRQTPQEVRGPLVARLVRRFSPLALFSAAGVGLTGIVTAWIHLKYLSALWTTAYGQVLILKLAFVALIVALGAWNWLRALPALGTETAAVGLRRSSILELGVALIVLMVSAVLSSMPSPKLPVAANRAAARAGLPPQPNG